MRRETHGSAGSARCGALALLLVARRENDSSRLGWKNRFSGAGLYLLTGIAVFSPWLIRNEVWARNPVFPEAARLIGSGDFSPPQVARWEHAYVPHVNAKERVETLWGQIEGDWRFGFVLLPLGIGGGADRMEQAGGAVCAGDVGGAGGVLAGLHAFAGAVLSAGGAAGGIAAGARAVEKMPGWQSAAIASIIGVAALGGAWGLERAWAVRVDEAPNARTR